MKLNRILRDPTPTVGGEAKLPEIKHPSTTVAKEPKMPAKDIEFNIEPESIVEMYGDVEQLPEQTGDKKIPEVKVTEKKPEVKAPVVEKKEEKVEGTEKKIPSFLKAPKKEGEVTKDSTVKPGTKPITPSARDYSGFSQEEATALKQMGNEGFALASKILKENKELSKLRDTTYLQHEQAYVLDPNYQQIQEDNQYTLKEAHYWQQQLVNMDAGKDLIPITGWNKDGTPILGAGIKPTKELEERVRVMLNNCYQQSRTLQGHLQQFPLKYKQAISQDLNAIQQYRSQQFGWVQDPTILDYTVNIEGVGERSLKQVREDVKSILPPYMKSHPLAEVLGDLVIALRIKEGELSELRSNAAVNTIKSEEQELVEPSSKTKPAAKELDLIHGIKEFSIDPSIGI